jgi:hypothetical protein
MSRGGGRWLVQEDCTLIPELKTGEIEHHLERQIVEQCKDRLAAKASEMWAKFLFRYFSSTGTLATVCHTPVLIAWSLIAIVRVMLWWYGLLIGDDAFAQASAIHAWVHQSGRMFTTVPLLGLKRFDRDRRMPPSDPLRRTR